MTEEHHWVCDNCRVDSGTNQAPGWIHISKGHVGLGVLMAAKWLYELCFCSLECLAKHLLALGIREKKGEAKGD